MRMRRLAGAAFWCSLSAIATIGVGACKKEAPPIEAEAKTAPAPTASSAPTAKPDSSSIARAIVDEAPPARISDKTLALSIFEGDPTWKAYDHHIKCIFVVGDQMVVTPAFAVYKGGELVAPEEGFAFEDFPGDAPENAPQRAIWLTYARVMGRYPSDLWVDASGTFGMIVPRQNFTAENAYIYQRQYGSWGRVKDAPVAAAPWSKGRTLAYLDTGEFKLAQPAKGKLAELPKQAPGEACKKRVSGIAMASSAAGEVTLLGTDCDRGRRLAIERWEADSGDGEALAKSRIIPLPSPEGPKPKSAWIFPRAGVTYAVADLFEGAWLAEVRGDAVKEVKLPVKGIKDAHAAADGSLFIVGNDNEIYRYDGLSGEGPGFTMATYPAKYKPKETTGLFADSRDLIFVAVHTEAKGSLILASRPTPPAVEEAVAKAEREAPLANASSSLTPEELLATFKALDADCKTPFVVLFPVTKSTPADFDFPQTQRIMKELPGREAARVIDFEHWSRRFVGVVTPDAKAAEALVEHWNKRDEKSKSRAVCFAPPASARDVKIP